MDTAELPPLDLILLSHFHGDHFDQAAERDLDKNIPIVTTKEAAKELRERGFNNICPLETWAPVVVRKGDAVLRITATPGRHGPPLSDFVLPELMGSILEFQAGEPEVLFRMYITAHG